MRTRAVILPAMIGDPWSYAVAIPAGEILGGAAIMHDHPMEKYLRDAASFLHSDGTNQICLLRAAEGLANQASGNLYGF